MNSFTVIGVFDSHQAAQAAVEQLKRSGFQQNALHVHAQEKTAVTEGGESEGFMDSVGHFFSNLFGDDKQDGGHYAEAVRRGGSVVAIDVDAEADVSGARAALLAAGAVDIEKRADEWRSDGYSGAFPGTGSPADVTSSTRPASSAMSASSGTQAQEAVVPVVREALEVGKREVELGAVRVYSRVVETPVKESIELREQHAAVERHPVDRVATQADLAAMQEGASIEIRETAERPVVSKTARVVEEVTVGTQASSTQQTISDTVRNTVVEVERSGNEGNMAAYRPHYESTLASQGAYEDFEPAYLYGSTLRADQRFADRSWSEVEPEAQRDWVGKYPQSTWERVKSAVQHGWDSATGRNKTM
ncbi:MAG: YsnF/AvaK domain-containing protein [Pseudomonadota bacterium]